MRFNKEAGASKMIMNYEGANAYILSPEAELYSTVVTASLSEKFYEGSNERLSRLRELIAKNDPGFVAKLAVYTRERMYLRSVPIVLAVELARMHKGDDLVSTLTERIIQRADEITELLSYYVIANERKSTKKLNSLSKQIQKGLAKAFNKFDEYQFAKYNREAAIKLKDALFLVHPKAKNEAQQELFNRIATDLLRVPYTWETELSALGQAEYANPEAKAAAFRAKWEELIDSGKLGYMAVLRNLRNMLQAEVSRGHIERVCGFLSDPKAVASSKQLPFRFLSAYRELGSVANGNAKKVLEALEEAVKLSVANMRGFDASTRVLVACDVSGSMSTPVSRNSAVKNFDIGLVLGMLLQNKCENVITGLFGTEWKVINVPGNNILANVTELYRRSNEVGLATNGYLVIEDLIQRQIIVDKVMMFTDCQMWNSRGNGDSMADAWNRYKRLAPEAKLYLFDLSGYGNTPVSTFRRDVFLVAGWSDKVFDVLEAIENDSEAVAEINKIEL
jgi:60 kDa SS-A/Ro ribonucleoprotein